MIHLMEDTLKIRSRSGKLSDWSRDKLHDHLVKVSRPIETSHCNHDESFFELNLPIREIVEYTEKQLSTITSIDELNMILTDYCSSMVTSDIAYGFLSSRLIHIHHHNNTIPSFSQSMTILWTNDKSLKPVVGESFYNDVMENYLFLDEIIDHTRDNLIDYFGFKTLERAYLLKSNGKIIERIQHLWMRVAVGLHKRDKEAIKQTYDLLSLKYFVHATPTLFNIGTPNPQMSSCYLVALEDDSINGIFNTISECASISKWAGGIGLHIHNIRGAGAPINGTNGTSNGIVPMLRVFNATARYVDQGGGRRNGSIAIYMEPWHSDIYEWVDMKRNQGDDELRARDLFYALWVPDLFMSRVEADQEWSLFSSDSAPGLSEVYGYKFKELYEKYEEEGRAYKKVKARELWMKILDSQMETGRPYILYKDAANTKSNQKNLGVIKSSNLCTEIMEYSDKDETAVCNLASISLPNFVTYPKFTSEPTVYTKQGCVWCDRLKILFKRRKISYKEIHVADKDIPFIKCKLGIKTFPRVYLDDVEIGGYTDCETYIEPIFDFEKLEGVVHVIVDNLNKIIDDNLYPTPKCKRSNFSHRPIGVGIQGLADVFLMMDMAFDSERANILNTKISATIYYAALEMSCKLSERRGRAMKTLMKTETIETLFIDQTDPVSKSYRLDDNDARTNLISECCPTVAEFSAAMSGSPPGAYSTFDGSPISNGMLQFDMWGVSPDERYDWTSLKNRIKRYGIRNSLLIAPMPTASTSQILGNNECFEPYTTNIYLRRTLAGEFVIVNKHLVNDLKKIGLWSKEMKDLMVKAGGSIQTIVDIPEDIKKLYRTVWEIKMKDVIDMAAARGRFIDQSQSMNLFMESPTMSKLSSMHMYAWKQGLKTGMYYLRPKAKARPIQFSLEPDCVACSA